MVLSSLIINAYWQMGHGALICSSYSARLFVLATVMYIDDTDILHWPPSAHTSPEDLIKYVQKTTTDWGNLAQASGGILKAGKCSPYFMDYNFNKGCTKLKSLQHLPEPNSYIMDKGKLVLSHISIPQPVRCNVPIVTHDVTTATKMLGYNFTLAGNLVTHMECMVQKGLDWVDSLLTKPLPSRDVWLSFYMQLFPGISWGLVAVCMLPTKLDKIIQQVYERALPFLGINCKIKKEWRTLPKMYQGLALPNFPLVALSAKISFLLENWGFSRRHIVTS